MWKAPNLAALTAVRASSWRGAEVAQLGLFVATEYIAALCRRRLEGPSGVSLGMATPVVAAALAMFWAFAAHDRLAFRFQAATGALCGFGPFLLVSWVCLDLQTLASHLAPPVALGSALVIVGSKFVLARGWVWRPVLVEAAR